jgi:hypothetical protein
MGLQLAAWTKAAIDEICRKPYGVYERGLRTHYEAYFAAHPELAGDHPVKARDLAAALPPGADFLEEYLPEDLRHRHHLSGRSSQVLALAILGLAWRRDQSVRWLEEALTLPGLLKSAAPSVRFEVEVEPTLLNESPLVSTIDFLVEDDAAVVCVEAKFGEDGMGRCSCPTGAPAVAACAQKVLARPLYWKTASEVFFLPERQPGKPCPISASYQAIRNVAAARALAGDDRRAVFALFYDERNPYFQPQGDWPGWPDLLKMSLDDAKLAGLVTFRAVSWQDLLHQLPLEDTARTWARDKHALG